MLDRHECFSVFHHLQKDRQRKQRLSLKLGKKRRKSSKRNYYIISPRVIIKAIIIMLRACVCVFCSISFLFACLCINVTPNSLRECHRGGKELHGHLRWNTLALWGWSLINPGVSLGGTSNSIILTQGYRTGPEHVPAGTALHPTSFLCLSRRWGWGEPGDLATL